MERFCEFKRQHCVITTVIMVSVGVFLFLLLFTVGYCFLLTNDDVNYEVEEIAEKVTYIGAQVLTFPKEWLPLILQIINEEDMDIWGANLTHVDVFVPKDKSWDVNKILQMKNIKFSIMIKDVQKALDEQNTLSEAQNLPGNGSRMNWMKYHRLSVIYSYLDSLAETYPDIASVKTIGHTHERRRIRCVKISSGLRNAAAIFIDAGIHAREWISSAAALYFIHRLIERRESLPIVMKDIDFYIVPVVNPDGYEYSHTANRLWRKNKSRNSRCIGTDLNRNFDFLWGGKGSNSNPCSDLYRGIAPFSEPETKALSGFILSLKPHIKAYISFHSYGQFILIPYGHNSKFKPFDYTELYKLGNRAANKIFLHSGEVYKVGTPPDILYPAFGTSADWMKAVANIKYTYTIEVRDKGKYGFILPVEYILPTAYENFEILHVLAAAESWKETEMKLLEKLGQNEQEKTKLQHKSNSEIIELKGKLKEATDLITILQVELKTVQGEKLDLEKINEDLTVDITRLNCEVEEYKREMENWKKMKKENITALENNATIQAKLSQANTEITKKQTEIVRLNGLIGQLRGELEKIRLGSVINQSAENLTGTISQLQAALAIERGTCKDIMKEKESMAKEIMDLKRQVKEMENILIKRSKFGSGLPLGEVYNPDFKEALERRNKELDSELSQKKLELTSKEELLNKLQAKYDEDVLKFEQEISKLKKDNESLKQSQEKPRPAGTTTVKEDAHLLATIRGLKSELSSREKDINRLNKELEDAKKTNKRLQKEREKVLNSGSKLRGNHFSKESDRSQGKVEQEKNSDYNPVLYEDDSCSGIFLRSENRNLRDEIKKLEQDLISLHNKRIQDLSDLQEQHELEITRMMRDHAAKHSTSTVAHLQGQLYTQQMVIHHLKEQVKILEERSDELALLKTERDHLETTLIEANKKIARLHELQSPESVQYSGLLEKLDFLERKHEIREQKLQSIVRDLISKQGQGLTCSSNCRDKLLNKNREICYYRAEMDKILDTLAEFRWNK